MREYKEFIHAHRSDAEDVAYARARMAEGTYAEIPESFLMPAAEERDQVSVVDAYKELKSYLADYPDSKQSPHVRELLAQVLGRLVRHELYVARYYLDKDNYDATVARVEYARRFAELPVAGLLSAQPIRCDPVHGRITLTFQARREFTNLMGSVQGGMLTAMLDLAMSFAVLCSLEDGHVVPSLEVKTSFIAPARPGEAHRRRYVGPPGTQHRLHGRTAEQHRRRPSRDRERHRPAASTWNTQAGMTATGDGLGRRPLHCAIHRRGLLLRSNDV